MTSIAHLSVRILRTALLSTAVMVTAGVADANAQALNPKAPSNAPSTSLPLGPPIRQIVVAGTQRIEPATVLSYISTREGDQYDEQAVDRSLKTLFATGLFADVKFRWNGQTLTIQVVENPIINQIDFEGNDKVSTKDLQKEVQLKPRTVFTRARVQSDVQRIIELYRRNGKFAATVDPQIIQRPQNRVDLIFSINEGATTGVARITFIGNKVFDDDTLRSQIATEESAWWKFLATNDNYDPDRLTFDREQLRRFYLSHGYADFNVVSAVAQLTPDRSAFYLTFTIDEGPVYKFGNVEIESNIKELDTKVLRAGIPIHSGDTYNAELIQKSIDALTNAAGTKGYAFAEVHPRIQRDRDKRTINVVLKIDQGPRVYVERINITGNTRTLDKVIRREMRLVEGDAFNRVLLDRSRTRIRALGFFKDVDIKTAPGTAPDKTTLNVAVTEQSTGELSLGAGYSSESSFVGEFSYTERNLFGRAQYLRLSAALSSISKQFQVSYTEPYFLDKPLAAGVDLIKYLTNFDQAAYQGDTSAVTFRLGFPTSEFGSVQLRYSYRIDKVTPYNIANIPEQILEAAGTTQTSLIGYTFSYNTLDDYQKPTKGLTFSFSQDFAGFGGTLKYMRAETSASVYHRLFFDGVIGSLTGSAGYITAYDGQSVRINERFFKGGDSFRGFQIAGIGPRDVAVPGNSGAIGGNVYAIGSINVRVPNFLPEDYGISTSLFSDFGTLGRIDRDSTTPTAEICKHVKPGGVAANSCIADNLALRASAGISVGWKSPFGPIQIDFGIPIAKTPYDRTEIIHFSAGTGL